MTAPLVMLGLLLLPYLVARTLSTVTDHERDARGAAALGLGFLFAFTGVGHFVRTDAMAPMLPPWVPERELLVLGTGFLELALAAGFLVPRTRHVAGVIAVALLVLFFPANVYAAMNHVPVGGHAWGPAYLLVRTPLQVVLLWWVCRFAIRRPEPAGEDAPLAAYR